MAEEHDNSQFGKGIALNCGFDLGAQHLLDNRCAVADWDELYSIPAIRRADGLVVWVRSEKRIVVWDAEGGQWVDIPTSWDPMYQYVGEHEMSTEYVPWINDRGFTHLGKRTKGESNAPLVLPYAIGGHAAMAMMGRDLGTSEILFKLLFPYVPPCIIWHPAEICVAKRERQINIRICFYNLDYYDGDINFDLEHVTEFSLDGVSHMRGRPFHLATCVSNTFNFQITRNEDETLTVSGPATEEAKAHIANFRLDCPHRQGVRLRYETLKNKFHKAYAASGKEVLVEQTHYVAPNYLVATFTMEELEAAAPDVCAAIKAGDAAEVEVSAANLEALGVTPDMFSNSTYAKNDGGTLSDADGKVLMLASTLPAHTLTVGNTHFGSETDNKGVTATFSFGEDSGVFGPYLNLKCHLLFLTVPDGATTWQWSRYDPTEYEYVEQEGESANEQ